MAKKKSKSSEGAGYVTGTGPDGMRQTYVSADVAKQYGAKLDATPDTKQVARSVRVSKASNNGVAAVSPASSSGQSSIAPSGSSLVSKALGVQPSPSKAATTSLTARTAVELLGNKIFNPEPIKYNNKFAPSETQNLLEMQRDRLDERRKAEIERINTDFAADQEALGEKQKKEVGTQSMSLARMGGFDSASGQASLTNLARVHNTEVMALSAKRENSIRMAQQAYEDKDFELSKMLLDDIKDTEQRIYDRQKDYIGLSLQIAGEERSQAMHEWNLGAEDRQMRNDMRNFALQNNVKKPFFEFGGTVFGIDGTPIPDMETALAMGVAQDFSNVETVEPPKNYGAGIIGEYQFYADQELAAGRQPLTFDQYQTKDANRKASIARAGAPTISDTSKEYDLLRKQAPATIMRMAKEGYSWEETANALAQLNLDPGEFEDAFQRSFRTNTEYNQYLLDQAKLKKAQDPEED